MPPLPPVDVEAIGATLAQPASRSAPAIVGTQKSLNLGIAPLLKIKVPPYSREPSRIDDQPAPSSEARRRLAILVGRQNRLVMEVFVVIRVAVSTPVNVTVACPLMSYAVRVNVPE